MVGLTYEAAHRFDFSGLPCHTHGGGVGLTAWRGLGLKRLRLPITNMFRE
jgi:hypothetical protein